MPRTKQANQEIRAAREEQIRTQAAHQFAHRGYVGTRIEDITQATGISKGLIYHYYGSKESLFTTLIERAARGTLHLYEMAYARPASAVERLRWLMESITAGLADQEDMFLVVMQAFVSDAVPPQAQSHARALALGALTILTGIIHEGQNAGLFVDTPAEQLALVVSSCIQGLAVARVMNTPTAAVTDNLMNLIAKR